MIQVGQSFPAVTVYEFNTIATDTCPVGPTSFDTQSALADKKIVITGAPGAFTPACSDLQVPGYMAHFEDFKQLGINEIWCVAVNDAFVMGAWGKSLHTAGKIRMVADGAAALTKALGLELDLSAKGFGVRSQRFSMLVENGRVVLLNLDAGVAFEKSTAEILLSQIKAL